MIFINQLSCLLLSPHLSGEPHHEAGAVVALERRGESPDQKLVTFWLEGPGAGAGQARAGPERGVGQRRRDPRVA